MTVYRRIVNGVVRYCRSRVRGRLEYSYDGGWTWDTNNRAYRSAVKAGALQYPESESANNLLPDDAEIIEAHP